MDEYFSRAPSNCTLTRSFCAQAIKEIAPPGFDAERLGRMNLGSGEPAKLKISPASTGNH